MSREWTKVLITGYVTVATVMFGACSDDKAAPETGEMNSTGTVSLALVSGVDGEYRLRHARFEFTADFASISETLDSEIDPDATTLSLALAQGSYSVDLLNGWALERLEGSEFVPIRAALLTPNPRTVRVRHGRVSPLTYTFTTDGGEVTFGEGSVSVEVGVVDPTLLEPCDLLDPGSCPDGQTCLMADADGNTFCADAGSTAAGDACDGQQCVSGAQCLNLDPEDPDAASCARFCDPSAPPFDCECRSLSFSEEVGVCVPSNLQRVVYEHSFAQGSRTSFESCSAWHDFRNRLEGGSYSSVTLAGTFAPGGTTCSDPAAATEICNSLAAGVSARVVCDGHLWNVGFCGTEIVDGSYSSAVELTIDEESCRCGFNSVRPCTDMAFGGGSFGGVGVGSCDAREQTVQVACMVNE
jgi:hypothetical protein